MPIAFLLLILFSIECYADPIELEKSASPDGKLYLTIEPSQDGNMFIPDMLQIHRSENKKVIGAFKWGQFGPRITSASATTLWRKDCQAFALTWNQARGWMGSEVYVKNSGKWTEVSFPLFKGKYVGQNGWESGSKGRLVVVSWLPENIVKTDYITRLDWHGEGSPPPLGDIGENDWVYFRLQQTNGMAKFDFLRFEQKTEAEVKAEYEQMLR